MIEKAIRSAFEKGNPSNQAFREKVYRQAFAALDRVLQANSGVTVETAMRRRKALQAKIVEIEQEFLPGRAPPAVEAKAPQPSQPAAPVLDVERPDLQPEIAAAAAPEPARRVEPAMAVVPPAVTVEVERPERRDLPSRPVDAEPQPRRGRNRIARFFVAATLFSMIAIGVWWAIQTGLIGSNEQPEPVATQPSEPEAFEPGAEQPPASASEALERNWIPVFGPSDADSMSAPADAKAEIMKGENGDFVRITSGGSGSAILFDVGQGVLEQIAGRKATFDIVARAEDGKDTQMSVLCNFGEIGDCGRKRYAVGNARADYLFDLQAPDKKPGAGGTIAINSDFDKAGKSVDIFEIKVSIDQ